MKKKNIFCILFVFLLVVIDQINKLLVVNLLENGNYIIIKNLLRFSFVKNEGAAFGILSGNLLILVIITLILILYIFREIRKNVDNKLMLFSYLLILSGALGNLIDRIFRGYVVDFISFRFFGKDMAIFNMADSYITVGVIALIIILIGEMYHGKNNSK